MICSDESGRVVARLPYGDAMPPAGGRCNGADTAEQQATARTRAPVVGNEGRADDGRRYAVIDQPAMQQLVQ
jgi:hypothetical protein